MTEIVGIPKLVGDSENQILSSISDGNGQITTTTLKPLGLLFPMSAIIGRHWNMSFPKPFFSWKNDQGGDRSLQTLHATSARCIRLVFTSDGAVVGVVRALMT